VLLAASALAGGFFSLAKYRIEFQKSWFWQAALLAAPWVSLLVFMLQSGLSGIGRIITPFYALCVPGLLWFGNQEQIVQKHWWKIMARAVFIIAAAPLILSPARPLWPAQTVLAGLQSTGHSNRLIERASEVYAVQRARANAFDPVLTALPAGTTVLGMITGDDPEAALWKPYSSRRIEHVLAKDGADELERKGIRYILVHGEIFRGTFDESFPQWMDRVGGEVVNHFELKLRGGQPPQDWLLVRVREEEPR
jgi:hypothetical protein